MLGTGNLNIKVTPHRFSSEIRELVSSHLLNFFPEKPGCVENNKIIEQLRRFFYE